VKDAAEQERVLSVAGGVPVPLSEMFAWGFVEEVLAMVN
jgi:hypothetical protein